MTKKKPAKYIVPCDVMVYLAAQTIRGQVVEPDIGEIEKDAEFQQDLDDMGDRIVNIATILGGIAYQNQFAS